MLIQTTLFILLIILIFLLSPRINTAIYQLALLLTRNKNLSMGILVTFLLPGTIIHELSHFVIATILFVPTGRLTIIPKIEDPPAGEQEGRIKAGSLHHADTDPIRRSLIGIAPMIIGLSIIYIIGKLLPTTYHLPAARAGGQFLISSFALLFFIFYLLFIVSISMFSSRKDLEVAGIFIPLVVLLGIALYISGLRISFTSSLAKNLTQITTRLDIYLAITLGLDLAVLLIVKTVNHLLQKILKVKVVLKN